MTGEFEGSCIDQRSVPQRSELFFRCLPRTICFCSPAVNADIIHQHLLGELSGLIRAAGKISAYCEVQDDEKRMVIYPLRTCRKIVRTARRIKMIIDIEANLLRFPFDGKQMEVIAEAFIVWQDKR